MRWVFVQGCGSGCGDLLDKDEAQQLMDGTINIRCLQKDSQRSSVIIFDLTVPAIDGLTKFTHMHPQIIKFGIKQESTWQGFAHIN